MASPRRYSRSAAPSSTKRVRQIGSDIVVAYDVFDSVGQTNDFTKARFFTDFAESYVYRAGRQGRAVDYVTICSPNHLHRAHIEFALRAGAHAIARSRPAAMTVASRA